MKELRNMGNQPCGIRLNGRPVIIGPGGSVQVDETQAEADRYIGGLIRRKILRLTGGRR